MRYTKPHVLTTVNANQAIQLTGNAPNGKNNFQIPDGRPNDVRSTTGAYPADE
jgi:hypothetical protein